MRTRIELYILDDLRIVRCPSMNEPNTWETMRDWLRQAHDHPAFQWFTSVVIVISALSIGASSYPLHPLTRTVLLILDYAITLYFVTEIAVRFLAAPNLRAFSRDGWNVFDTLIVVGSLIPLDNSQHILLGRLLRLFRVLRLVSFVPQLRVLVEALLLAIPRMGYVTLLMFIIFYIYGCLGNLFFKDSDPDSWRDVGTAMLTLFQIATFDNWARIMHAAMSQHHPLSPLSWIYFLSFIFLIAFVFFNMMIGVIVQVLQEKQTQVRAELAAKREEAQTDSTQPAVMQEQLGRIETQLEVLAQQLRDQS